MCKKYKDKEIKGLGDKMLEYFQSAKHYEEFEQYDINGEVVGYKRYPTAPPTFERFAFDVVKVSAKTLWYWATQKDDKGNLVHPHFADCYLMCKDDKLDKIRDGALRGMYTGQMSMMELRCQHNYMDDVELSKIQLERDKFEFEKSKHMAGADDELPEINIIENLKDI